MAGRRPRRRAGSRSRSGWRTRFRGADRDRRVDRRRGASVGAGPGLLLDDDVALDREHAAGFAEFEQVDELRVDVQLVAVLAQAARDAEAQALAAILEPERRVEPGHDQLVRAARTAFAEAGHASHAREGPRPHT